VSVSAGAHLVVSTEQVSGAAGRLGAVPDDLTGAAAWFPQTAGGADDTDAAEACAELARQWQYALERMADSGRELAAAVNAAAECYAVAEASNIRR
jgi:hypothetical protein